MAVKSQGERQTRQGWCTPEELHTSAPCRSWAGPPPARHRLLRPVTGRLARLLDDSKARPACVPFLGLDKRLLAANPVEGQTFDPPLPCRESAFHW